MAIEGFFDPSDPNRRPWLTAALWLPRLGLWRALDFVIDTGADVSLLAWKDEIGFIPADTTFEGIESAGGVSGSALYGTETAYIIAADPTQPNGLYGYAVNLWIARNAAETPRMSLLGRDFMTQLHLHMDMPGDRVWFDTPLTSGAPNPSTLPTTTSAP